MKVLMISPHPTYSPRGTPISVLNRCRALSALGHQVDLVTYGIGENVPVPGLRYLRAPVPGIHSVKIGPSVAKVPLDAAVLARALVRLIRGRRSYDVLHTHEEAGILGTLLTKRLPHVYDMGNDLSVVLGNYGYGPRHPAHRAVARIESAVVRSSDVVIAHFPSIAERVLDLTGAPERAVVVPNVALEAPPVPSLCSALRQRFGVPGIPLVLYTGTLEAYQGLDLMVEAIARLARQGRRARLVVVGGRPDQQDRLRAQARAAGLDEQAVLLAGTLPPEAVPSALAIADVVVSPRATGTNTPLKLFSYLASGRPILATAIASHTQVLSPDCAELVTPDAPGLADGLERLLADPQRAAAIGHRARALAESGFGVQRYLRDVATAYSRVGAPAPSGTELQAATERLTAGLVPGHD